MIRAKIKVSGFVQGVGFRWFAYKKATGFNLRGFVKNLDNGDVYCEAEGEKDLIEEFIGELRKGPTFSKVKDIKVEWLESKEPFNCFEIKE